MAETLYALAWIGAFAWPLVLWLVWRDARRRRAGRWSLARRFWSSLLTACWAVCVWAFLIEPETLVVRRVTIESATWTGPPLRIGLISDTHVGSPHVDAARVGRIVARMNGERPDMVVLLGDYVGGHARSAARTEADRANIRAGIKAFANLSPPFGVAAVFGNHDWWYDGADIERTFAAAGIPILENRSIPITRPRGAFWIAGLADQVSERRQPSFTEALRDVPTDAPVIAIGHRPDIFFTAPARLAVTLVGHSHCGQINLLPIGRPFTAGPGSARWPCGAYDEGGRKLYVTGGVGVSILPARLRAPPEIVVVTLKSKSKSGAPGARASGAP